MLKKKNTSLITLTLLIAIAGLPKSVEASLINPSNHYLNSQQFAQVPTSETKENSQNQSKFPWWLLVLVAFVPFLGWFVLVRNNQTEQESTTIESFSAASDLSSPDRSYGNNLDQIKTENNLNPVANHHFEDNTIMAATVTSNSDLDNQFDSKHYSFAEQTNQTNLEQSKLSPLDSDLEPINQPESVVSSDEIILNSQSTTVANHNLNNEIEQLSTLDTDLTSVEVQESNHLSTIQNVFELEKNQVEQLSTLDTELTSTNHHEYIDRVEQNSFSNQENRELIDDKIGNITEWLEQLDFNSDLSYNEQTNFLASDNSIDRHSNFNEPNQLNDIENGLDLESFEQLLFGDLDSQEEPKNPS